MWGDESENFAKLPDYIKRFKDVDPQNFAALDTNAARQFQATLKKLWYMRYKVGKTSGI